MSGRNTAGASICAGGLLLCLGFPGQEAHAATNDSFASAQIIAGSSGMTSGDNIGATKQPTEPDHADDSGGSSVWFSWTAPASGVFLFHTFGSGFDTLLAVYTGNMLNHLTPVASNDDANLQHASALSFAATSGTTYRVAIDGYGGDAGEYVLTWGPEIPPANDNFTNAQLIAGSVGSTSGSSMGASLESGEPVHAGAPGGRSVWFQWTASSTNAMWVTTAGSGFDTTLAVYTGTSVDALVEVASNDDFEEDGTSAVLFDPSPGTVYRIAVDGFAGGMGDVMLNWQPYDSGAGFQPAFAALHHFTNDFEGSWPQAPVIGHGDRLYGTTPTRASGDGTVFSINPDGSGFTVLKAFVGGTNGGSPYAPLIASGGILYGALAYGGAGFRGAVFAIGTDGTGYNLLHSFSPTSGSLSTNVDGSGPEAGLVLSGDTLFGVARYGGNFGSGTVFSLKTNGTDFTTLHHFPELVGVSETNSDGARPVSSLVVAGDTLYGVAAVGGNLGFGTVFTLKSDGTGFGTLCQFDGTNGLLPKALIRAGGTLFGTTTESVFALSTNGTGFTRLASFAAPGRGNPDGPIVLSGDRIYGSTYWGGTAGNGTVYSIRTNGTGYVALHQFPPTADPVTTNSDGALPHGVSFHGNALYGAAEIGGVRGCGTVFRLVFPPPILAIAPAGSDVVLQWPASPGGFHLESTTNPASPSDWTTNIWPTTTLNGYVMVTNPTAAGQMLFRLKMP